METDKLKETVLANIEVALKAGGHNNKVFPIVDFRVDENDNPYIVLVLANTETGEVTGYSSMTPLEAAEVGSEITSAGIHIHRRYTAYLNRHIEEKLDAVVNGLFEMGLRETLKDVPACD